MDDLVTAKEAAKLLGVSPKAIYEYTRQGLLTVDHSDGGNRRSANLYKLSELDALLEVQQKNIDLPTVAAIAKKAHVAHRQTERMLKRLMSFLQLDVPMPSLEEEDVRARYYKIEHALEQDLPPTVRELHYWADFFYAMGEEYMGAIEDFMEDEEPWKKPMDLALKLSASRRTRDLIDSADLRWAYSLLDAGRRNLRSVAYFYVRSRHGKNFASIVFPKAIGDVEEEIIDLAFLV